MDAHNSHLHRGSENDLKASRKAGLLTVYTRHRPLSDGRLQQLIPSLPQACSIRVQALQVGTQGLAKALFKALLFNSSKAHVRKDSSKAEKTLSAIAVTRQATYINSIDLQPIAFLNQIIFGQKTWLDLLENDATNARANQRRAGLRLSTRLFIIRLLQKMVVWNNVISVAEECFYNEIKFGSQKAVLLSHETVSISSVEQKGKPNTVPMLLVTGTLGHHYGTLDAVDRSAEWLAHFPHRLRIVGPAPDPAFAGRLREAAALHPDVELVIYPAYQPQTQILAEMRRADYLLCPYHLSDATRNRIPTKFHEAAHTGLTLIFPANPAWERWCLARHVPYRLINAMDKLSNQSRMGLRTDWVSQRLALQLTDAQAAIKTLI